MKKLMILLTFLILTSGCVSQETSSNADNSVQEQACVALCQDAINRQTDITNGPCLSDNNPLWSIGDWVCDVAHHPRQAIDDQQENQCQAFRNGEAKHFVEVDEYCRVIKSV